RLELRVDARVDAVAGAVPDAVPLESRRRQEKPAALLEPAVKLGLDEERRRHAHETSVERPPSERVDDVLTAEAKAEPPFGEVAPLDVAVHEVDRGHVETGNEPLRGRRVGRFVGVDARIGVEAKAQLDRDLGATGHRLATLEVVDAECERLQEAAA